MTATTQIRKIGQSALATPRLVLGGNVFGWTANEADSFDILDRFVTGGGTMIDTADVYSAWVEGNRGGESETVIGNWLKRRGHRDDVLIATKVGLMSGLTRPEIEAAVDASLTRLQTDYIDLYYTHKDHVDTPLEETLGYFDALVRAGKVRTIGASQIEADRLAAAIDLQHREGWARYEVLQTWYNLVERDQYEGALADVVAARGIGMLSFFSLANGYLTGKYRVADDRTKSARGDRVKDYMEGKGPAVLAALGAVAAETGASPAQISLAWLAAKPSVTAPIASETSVAQLDELLGAMTLDLSADQVARLDAAS